jgi:hypothetical protein
MAEADPASFVQLDFFSVMPGFAGGRALLAQRGVEHFRHLATLSSQRPQNERAAAARSASVTRRQRRYTLPRTRVYIELDEQVTERIVPYWPHRRAGRVRTRPVMVHIELARERVCDDEEWLYRRLEAMERRQVRETSPKATDSVLRFLRFLTFNRRYGINPGVVAIHQV